MKKPCYIAFDCETGGVTDKESLLSVFFLILDEDFNEIDYLSLFLKPNDSIYLVKAQALEVNKINLIEHDKIAITYSEAGQKFVSFLRKHSVEGSIKLIPVGHNIFFDEICVWNNLLGKLTYQKYVSYRRQDTGAIAQFLKAKKLMSDTVTGSLTSLIEFYGIKPLDFHTAEGDTRMTVEILKAMLK